MARHLLAYVAMFLLVCGSAKASHASSFCVSVWYELGNCLNFLTGFYADPTLECCNSVRTLNTMAKSDEAEPQSICECIEGVADAYRIRFVASLIQDLPIKCNAHLSFPISNSMDCTNEINH
ncbi:non-specific lipid-transfer protein 13 [Pyrus ussuriensis x Pyrus communis]|uniref:Non-specific lipid-transfer protein 13 n=1 Tax=Pyrus ussuriensis x Pyrus communis TaxID=2448454 RepID=A0A5N5HA36_9ROSA|nr:non-specific lipid-transfer protein 13 [Pyrus ussuriensis x Pyrus communis]